MRWKAIATDLDGTLLDGDGTLSPGNREALLAAREAGLEVILATARWYRLALPVARALDLDGPMIACQGAEVRRISDQRDLLDLRLPEGFSEELFSVCDSMRCLAWIPFGERVLMKADGRVPDLPEGVEQVGALGDALQETPRMALIQGTEVCRTLLAELAPRWSDRVRFAASVSSRGKTVLALTASAVNKGVALTRACEDLGIGPEEVVAFGDAENDIEMFERAGYSFAMGQAEEAVREAADGVTTANTEDGVAEAVGRILRGEVAAP